MNEEKLKQIRSFQIRHGIISRSPLVAKIIGTILEIAETDISVLITGESGTGKEVFAQALHNASKRKNNKIIAVNCAAIPESILESELFGHEKGSFTGAQAQRKGYFEMADGGTIFLDEIGEMPLSVQVKFLRVLETKEIMRVGSEQSVKIDVRIVAATNIPLEKAVAKGKFREDLFYRLNTIRLKLPPLRHRKEDIPLLADFFINSFAKQNDIDFTGMTKEAYLALMEYGWQGNVRELKNVLESVTVLERNNLVTPEIVRNYLPKDKIFSQNANLPVHTGKSPEQAEREIIYRMLLSLRSEIAEIKSLVLKKESVISQEGDFSTAIVPFSNLSNLPEINLPVATPSENRTKEEEISRLQDLSNFSVISDAEDVRPIDELIKDEIYKALRITNQNRRKASKMLGISERTLYRKIDEYEKNDK
ncbi:MAG: sigma-54-dependent Fis family transcriptional regulator [Calditrichaeota bacterium]|nr:MAG: sigma-54-dependent Fis family transcriptional regulator [Calditrichota bacterium]